MTLMEQEKVKNKDELEKLIDRAIKKVRGSKENDLCKFLPGPSGGYMHHFTLRKLKNADPSQLFTLLQNLLLKQTYLKPWIQNNAHHVDLENVETS